MEGLSPNGERLIRMTTQGRILITGSIAVPTPGIFQPGNNGAKAFLDNFFFALRPELSDSGVTVTCLMSGAADTEIFERTDLEDTEVGQGKRKTPQRQPRPGTGPCRRERATWPPAS